MASIPRSTIEESLLKKGFVYHKQEKTQSLKKRDHRFYYFYHNNKRTHIRTRISMGSHYKDYGNDLLKKMKRQLRFDSLSHLVDFLKCPLTKNNYVTILKRNGEL